MFKSIPIFVACGLLLFGSAAQAAPRISPDAQIAKITAGRTAGAQTDCIRQMSISSSQIVDGTAIVYRMNDGTIYVNRPSSGASALRRDNVLVTDTHSDQLCSIDIVRLLDSGTRMQSGTVGLGPFVPYRPASR
ncbi:MULTISPECIES: hypothetical protein [unclassified Novosphingobium]|uniref:hypothetical protein n=1 Tax=unclassified Novosphingobium TaxID=2644732 RepID=UPI001359C5F7|nr:MULTISPECIES: hypothetical protein [unclassified Novosphingobium]